MNRIFKNGECVKKNNSTNIQDFLKIVGIENKQYVTFSYSDVKQNLFKTERVLFEDYGKKDINMINNNYVKVQCPTIDSIFNVDEYLESVRKK
jgi:hypothetical protein